MKSIYDEAVDYFGSDKQKRKVLEELAELQVAIHHYDSAKCCLGQLITEIVDVEIMLKQLRIIFKIDEKLIQKEKYLKLERLEDKILKDRSK